MHYAGLGKHVRRTLLIAAIAISGLISAAGCVSRTLPLPPPEVSSVSVPYANGSVAVSGFALEGASIGVVNDRTLQGTIVTSPSEHCDNTCPFEARLPARPGDTLRVWQFFETESAMEASVPQALP